MIRASFGDDISSYELFSDLKSRCDSRSVHICRRCCFPPLSRAPQTASCNPLQRKLVGRGCGPGSVANHLPGMCKALDLIPNTTKQKTEQRRLMWPNCILLQYPSDPFSILITTFLKYTIQAQLVWDKEML